MGTSHSQTKTSKRFVRVSNEAHRLEVLIELPNQQRDDNSRTHFAREVAQETGRFKDRNLRVTVRVAAAQVSEKGFLSRVGGLLPSPTKVWR